MNDNYEKHDEGAELYKRYLSGENSAFDIIIEKYRPYLISFAYGILHNISDAEDAAMDAFADLIIHRHRFSFNCALKTYLFTLTRHKAVDKIRRSRFTYDGDFETATADKADVRLLEDEIIRNDEAKAVRDALSYINNEYEEMLRIIYFYGFSGDEIIKITGKNKKQIANITYRAKEALRKVLAEGGGIK